MKLGRTCASNKKLLCFVCFKQMTIAINIKALLDTVMYCVVS